MRLFRFGIGGLYRGWYTRSLHRRFNDIDATTYTPKPLVIDYDAPVTFYDRYLHERVCVQVMGGQTILGVVEEIIRVKIKGHLGIRSDDGQLQRVFFKDILTIK